MNVGKFRDCRGILFDFGGTLDSDGEHWLDRFYFLYRQARLGIPPAEIKRAFYRADELCCGDPQVKDAGLRPLMRHHVSLQFEALSLDAPEIEQDLAGSFCARSERFLRRNAQLLRGLGSRFRMGVVSNFYGNVAVLCAEARLSESLEVILDSTRFGTAKPDPRIFRAALQRLDLPPSQVVFVGDSYERDMIPARELGMRTVWMKGPNPRIPLNGGPVDAVASDLTELKALNS